MFTKKIGSKFKIVIAISVLAMTFLIPILSFTSKSNDISSQNNVNSNGLVNVTEDIEVNAKFKKVKPGRTSTWALDMGGDIWGWGDDYYGQMGNGGGQDSMEKTTTPWNITQNNTSGFGKAKWFSAGITNIAAIDMNDELWMWGENYYSQSGNPDSRDDIQSPLNVSKSLDIGTVKQVSAFNRLTLLIDANDDIWELGYTQNGVQNLSELWGENGPEAVSQVKAGIDNFAAIDMDGDLWMWGENQDGQLGNGTTDSVNKLSPWNVTQGNSSGLGKVKKVALGGNSTSVIDENDDLWLWGDNAYGQIGNGISGTDEKVLDPWKNPWGIDIKEIGMLHDSSGFIDSNDELWMWGYNQSGQLGTGDSIDVITPWNVSENTSLGDVKSYFGGTSFTSAAIDMNDDIWMWGSNYSYQIGNGDITNLYSPEITKANLFKIIDFSISNITQTTAKLNYEIKIPEDIFSTLVSMNLSGTGIDNINIPITSGIHTVDITGLTAETTYDDWEVNGTYSYIPDSGNNLTFKTEMESFETLVVGVPVISSVESTSIENSVKIDYTVADPSTNLKSLILSGTGIEDTPLPLLDGSQTITIESLPGKDYTDWVINGTYDIGAGIVNIPQLEVPDFTIQKEIPVISGVSSIGGKEKVTISYNVVDPGSALEKITLTGTGIEDDLLNLPIKEGNNEYIVNGLAADVTYDDWNLKAIYNLGIGGDDENDLYPIPEFSTIKNLPSFSFNNYGLINSHSAVINYQFSDTSGVAESLILSGTGIADTPLPQINLMEKAVFTLGGLTDKTTYDDLKVTLSYDLGYGSDTEIIEYNLPSFTTAFIEPGIKSTRIEEVSTTSVRISWQFSFFDESNTINSLILSGTGIEDMPVSSHDGINYKTLTGLTPGTTYDDWELNGTYEGSGGGTISRDFPEFSTANSVPPEITEVSISDVGFDSAKLNYKVVEPNSGIDSMTRLFVSGTGIVTQELPFSGGTHSIDLTGLTPGTEYDDLKINGTYDIGFGVSNLPPIPITKFTTLGIVAPTVTDVSISNKTQNTVKLNYKITDINLIMESLTLSGTGIEDTSLAFTPGEHILDITGLTTDTTYSDWVINGKYNYGPDQISLPTISIDPFTTIADIPTVTEVDVTDITKTTVKLNYTVTDANAELKSLLLSGTGIEDTSLTFTAGSHIQDITGLTSGTHYNDWVINGTYDMGNGDQELAEISVKNFSTSNSDTPTVTSVSISDKSSKTVKLNYTVTDPDSSLESLTLSGTGIEDTLLTLTAGSHIQDITGLTPETTYDDWVINGKYDVGEGEVSLVEIEVVPFTTTSKQVPVITGVLIEGVSLTSVKVKYTVADPDSAITSLVLSGTGISKRSVVLDFTPGEHEMLVENLTEGTSYSDWAITGSYDTGGGAVEFPDGSIPEIPPFVPEVPTGDSKRNLGLIIGASVGGFVGLVLLGVGGYFLFREKPEWFGK